MPRFFPGGEYGPRTPVETRENVVRNRENEARIPVVQSSWAALALVASGASGLLFIAAAGVATFWGITAVMMGTTLIWVLLFGREIETEYEVEDEQGNVETEVVYGPTSRTWTSALLSAVFVGFLAFCVHRFLAVLGLTFPAWCAKPAAVLSIFFLTYSVWFLLHVETRFLQDLLYVSFHMEEALAHILEAFGLREIKKPKPGAQSPRVIDRGRYVKTNGRNAARQLLDVTEAEMDAMPGDPDRETLDAMEFLVCGQRIVEDGAPILYSRRKWDGRKLSSGAVVTVRTARRWAEALAEVGVLQNYADRGFDLAEGLTLGDALDAFALSQEITPPPPQRLREWGKMQGRVPARPDQAQASQEAE